MKQEIVDTGDVYRDSLYHSLFLLSYICLKCSITKLKIKINNKICKRRKKNKTDVVCILVQPLTC